jgi:hypothetical protein
MSDQDLHPLNRNWTLYYDGGTLGVNDKTSKNNTKWKKYSKVCTFGTIEDFWRCVTALMIVRPVGLLDESDETICNWACLVQYRIQEHLFKGHH